MKTIVEIHAGEGGEDSSLFVNELGSSYVKMIQKGNTSD